MIFSTITQNKLTVTADTTEIPAQYSNNIQFEFIQDTENYPGYTPTVYATLYDSSLIECADVLNVGGNVAIENGIFTIGNQILYRSGYLAIGITLTNGDENVALPPVIYKVLASVGGLSPLPPDDGEWQQVVDAYVNTLFETWSTENLTPIQNQLESLVSQAQQLQQTATNQQKQINNAISVMGDYQIVSEDPVQIQFKKGNGDFGPTVDLGDGLASKSMVNGKYYQSAAEMYSGAASNYGIQVQQIMGAYVQDGTPTPDNPVEPEFNVINNFNTNGGNLFDASKLSTTSQGGVTVTNNGDGSFTISGSGNVSETFNTIIDLEHEESVKLIKSGKIYYSGGIDGSRPSILIRFTTSVNQNIATLGEAYQKEFDLTEDIINDPTFQLKLGFYANLGDKITPQTIKPMLYQDGDGTWYPFNVSNTPVSLELRALPDGTADVWEDGNITRNVAKVTFDGSDDEEWGVYSTNVTENYTKFLVKKPSDMLITNDASQASNQLICNSLQVYSVVDLISSTTNQINGIAVYNSAGYIYICLESSKASNVEELRTYLQSNPISLWYILSTPTTEPLEIPILTSYYPFTNAWCDSQVPGMITWNVLTGNVKIDQLDPAIEDYVNDNVPNLINNYISQNVPDMITSAVDSALASYCPHKIGDVYITMNDDDPSTVYPGTTWQLTGKGQTLIGVDADNPTFESAGMTGGSLSYNLQILTSINTQGTTASSPGYGGKVLIGNSQGNGGALSYPIDITPSFITCYFWKRTA